MSQTARAWYFVAAWFAGCVNRSAAVSAETVTAGTAVLQNCSTRKLSCDGLLVALHCQQVGTPISAATDPITCGSNADRLSA